MGNCSPSPHSHFLISTSVHHSCRFTSISITCSY